MNRLSSQVKNEITGGKVVRRTSSTMQETTRTFTLGTAVLAGGKSSRMGQNKVLMEYQNRRFLDRICDELRGFDEETCISAAAPGEYEYLGLPVVCDENREIGPIEGIRQVLLHTSCDYVFVCAGDMPFITGDLVRYMAEFISSDYDCYCMVDEEHVHPLCAIYSKDVLPVIEELIRQGQYRLLQILRRVRTKYIRLESSSFDKKQLRNINTREEYERLSLPLVFCVSGIKDSGKTGLIIKLINEFIRDGYSVGVIKHDGHEYIMDHEGTDTQRFTAAGAQISAIYSGTQSSVNRRGEVSVEQMIGQCSGVDVLILEGQKSSVYPKVEVVRSGISDRPECDPKYLIAIATDVVKQDVMSCPVYDMNDAAGIYTCILKYFGRLL